MTDNLENWEEEFNQQMEVKEDWKPNHLIVKDFIRTLLSSQREEFRKTLNSGRKMYLQGRIDEAKTCLAAKRHAQDLLKELNGK